MLILLFFFVDFKHISHFFHKNHYNHIHINIYKTFYYINKDGRDNYTDIVQNISRNFTDMKLMRDRVVNKTFCETLE